MKRKTKEEKKTKGEYENKRNEGGREKVRKEKENILARELKREK